MAISLTRWDKNNYFGLSDYNTLISYKGAEMYLIFILYILYKSRDFMKYEFLKCTNLPWDAYENKLLSSYHNNN